MAAGSGRAAILRRRRNRDRKTRPILLMLFVMDTNLFNILEIERFVVDFVR